MNESPRPAERKFYFRLNYYRLRSSIDPYGIDLGAKRILADVPESAGANVALRITLREANAEYNPLGQFGVAWSLGSA